MKKVDQIEHVHVNIWEKLRYNYSKWTERESELL